MSQTDAATKLATRTVPVFANRRKVELPVGPMTVPDLLVRLGFEGTEWELLQLQGQGDPSGGTLLLSDAIVDVEAGLHFRILPGNRTFGASTQPGPEEPPECGTSAVSA